MLETLTSAQFLLHLRRVPSPSADFRHISATYMLISASGQESRSSVMPGSSSYQGEVDCPCKHVDFRLIHKAMYQGQHPTASTLRFLQLERRR